MMSFMEEQGQEDLSSVKQPVDVSQAAADTAEKVQDEEYFTLAERRGNVRRTTYLLAVLFGIGLLCLWFMIKKSTPQMATAAAVSTEQARIEVAIAQLTGVRSEVFNRMDEIVKKFYEFSNVRQVQADELMKNPFRYEMSLSSLNEAAGFGEMNSGVGSEPMQLLSIIRSDRGYCCMFDIDDRILYEGDSIAGFNVLQIGDNFVKLESEGKEITLRLPQ